MVESDSKPGCKSGAYSLGRMGDIVALPQTLHGFSMPLGLHASCKNQLVKVLAARIGAISVTRDKVLDYSELWLALSEAEKILPQGKIRDQLVGYIDENPIRDFVFATLTEELDQASLNFDAPRVPLQSIPGFNDCDAVARRLVEKLDALPHKYSLTIRLPDALKLMIGPEHVRREISDELRLVRATAEFKGTFPLPFPPAADGVRSLGLLGLLYAVPREWKDDALYLQMDIHGFVDLYGGTDSYHDALRICRSVFGLGFASRMFEVPLFQPYEQSADELIVHQLLPDGAWNFLSCRGLNSSFSRALQSLTLNRLGDMINSQELQDMFTEQFLKRLAVLFKADQKRAQPVLLGAQWHFDAAFGDDDLLRFVRSTIVMEIILGDKVSSDKIGLNELLRNRCAYLVGTSHEERSEIYETFGKIYAVRSQIVHRGKPRLSRDETILLYRLRSLCGQVIVREIELLGADRTT